jgi:hypothetical protein
LLVVAGLGLFTLIFWIWNATSVWAFPRFVIFVFLVIYLPGKLLMDLSKTRLRILEDLTLSLVLGMASSSLLYWMLAFFQLPVLFLLWPLSALVVWLLRRKNGWRAALHSRTRVDLTHLLLVAVLALQLVPLCLLPMYYQNVARMSEGEMSFLSRPRDTIFHLSIANELRHSIPPQVPYLAGQPLGYHYGMDLLTAMLGQVGGISTLDLVARFTPTFLLVVTALSVFCFSRIWLGSGYWAVLVAFLVVLGEGLSFLPGLLLGSEEVWSVQFFGAPTTYSLYFMNPMLPALGILFAGLFCLVMLYRDGPRFWPVLAAFLFAVAMEYKIFVTAHVLIALGAAGLVYTVLFRDRRLLTVLILTVLMTLPLAAYGFLGTEAGARVWVRVDPWPYIPTALGELGLQDTPLGNQVSTIYDGGPVTLVGLLIFLFAALPAYLVGTLGIRVLALPEVVKGVLFPSSSTPIRFFLGVMVIVGPLIALTFSMSPWGYPAESEYNEAIWFFVVSIYVATVLAVKFVMTVCRGRRVYLQGVVVTVLLVLSVPSTAQFFQRQMHDRFGVVEESELEVMKFLDAGCSRGEVVQSRQDVAAVAAAVTKCRVPVLNIGAYSHSFVSPAGLDQRRTDRDTFWDAWNSGELRGEILDRYDVDYVVVDRRRGDAVPGEDSGSAALSTRESEPLSLTMVYQNQDFAVYGVLRDDEPTA